MAAHKARDGRRRRVLNEEVRAASSLNLADYPHAADADAPRYGEQASVENHPQITDYVPRRKRAVIVTLLAGLGVAAGAQALTHFAGRIAESLPGLRGADAVSSIASSVAAWTSALALAVCYLLARLIYSLRRHRVDDYAGRYRVWRCVAWGAMLASLNAVVHIERPIAAVGAAGTGWSLTAGGAEWWLAPLALIGGWIAVRLLLEVSESRSTATFYATAMTCYAAAAVGALGWSPQALGAWAGPLLAALPLAGHTLALAGLMVFGRYVVLDVQGLIDHKPRSMKQKPEKKAGPAPAVKLAAATAEETPAAAASPSSTEPNVDESQWWAEHESEQAGRKLTKAERKQLRREQRRAA